ncbi:MAG: type VI secretion system-associated FHA domain protein TagH [Steroidobacteraceae bacterium]
MALQLRVISDQRDVLGERARIVLGVGGGSIGRAMDNDWVLPDPQRYLSGRHARVHFRQGAYYLEDTSTNGVYVNGSDLPVSRSGAYALRDGDRIRIGDYMLSVAIDLVPDLQQDGGSIVQLENIVPVAHNAPDDLGASLNFEALIHADGSSSDSFGPADEYGNRIRGAPRLAIAAKADTGQRLVNFREAARKRRAAQAPALQDIQAGLQAFCRGAGIDVEKLPADAQGRLLHLAGQLFREAVVGLKENDRVQHDLRNQFRIEQLQRDADRPAPGDLGVEEFAVRLFEGHEKREFDAVLCVRDAFRLGRHHEQSLPEAIGAAFRNFIARLDPAELEARFKVADNPKARSGEQNWALYSEIYRNLTQMNEGQLPHLYVEAFAQAYLEAMRGPDSLK